MGLNVKLGNGEELEMDSMPFSSTYECEFFKVVSSNYKGYCVKVFLNEFRNDQKAIDKQKALCNYSGHGLTSDNSVIYCWPHDIVYHGQDIIGTLNPELPSGSISFQEVCNERLKKNVSEEFMSKYDRDNSLSFSNRINICNHFCKALKHIENDNSISIIDLHPKNIYVTNNDTIFLDIFSNVQFTPKPSIMHHGKVTQTKYLPPESKSLDINKNIVSGTWDRFSIAVIIYEILIGSHPFSIQNTGINSNVTTIDESISKGLYKNGSNSKYIDLEKNEEERFNLLSNSIKLLFNGAFEIGLNSAHLRPLPSHWVDAFNNIDSYSPFIQNQELNNYEETEQESIPAVYPIDETVSKDNQEYSQDVNNINITEPTAPTKDNIGEEKVIIQKSNENEGSETSELRPSTVEQIYKSGGLRSFCINNKKDFGNNEVFESLIKRLWERMDILNDNEYVSQDNISIEKHTIKRGLLPKYLGFTPIDFKVEFRDVEIVHLGKEKTTKEIDNLLLEEFGQVYQKLIS